MDKTAIILNHGQSYFWVPRVHSEQVQNVLKRRKVEFVHLEALQGEVVHVDGDIHHCFYAEVPKSEDFEIATFAGKYLERVSSGTSQMIPLRFTGGQARLIAAMLDQIFMRKRADIHLSA